MEKILKIEDATIRYREQILLEDISWEIGKGQHWAIVGESGSGKSALLQTLAGKHIVAKGAITHYFFEEFLKENPVSDPFFTYHDLISLVDIKHDFRNLSHTHDFYYQQRYNAWDSDDAPTVEEFLNEKATPIHNQQRKWTVERVIETFNLKGLTGKQLIKLSNGESKRLRIAAALLKNPMLLLLDNPLAGLDAGTRQRFSGLFRDISDSGVTLVMVTSPDEIPGVITHVASLNSRRLENTFKRTEFKPQPFDKEEFRLPEETQIKKLIGREETLHFEVVVKMDDVSVQYGNVRILNKINWEIKPGERWALSGPNGSGKSTLLSLINGDNPQAYANEITLFDRRRGTGESIWDLKKKIGFMSPELYQYFPMSYTCRKVVESGFYDTMGLFTESDAGKQAVALEWLELMQLRDFADERLSALSASRQRLCLLARSLVKNPYLLILDEPCQGLDQRQQLYFRGLIDKVCELSDLSLIYVTHYREEIPFCVSHVFTLH